MFFRVAMELVTLAPSNFHFLVIFSFDVHDVFVIICILGARASVTDVLKLEEAKL